MSIILSFFKTGILFLNFLYTINSITVFFVDLENTYYVLKAAMIIQKIDFENFHWSIHIINLKSIITNSNLFSVNICRVTINLIYIFKSFILFDSEFYVRTVLTHEFYIKEVVVAECWFIFNFWMCLISERSNFVLLGLL